MAIPIKNRPGRPCKPVITPKPVVVHSKKPANKKNESDTSDMTDSTSVIEVPHFPHFFPSLFFTLISY